MKVKDNGGGDFQRPDPGTYLARCTKIVDLGTQSGEYAGKPTSRRQVVLTWELPTELLTSGEYAGQPMTIAKFYTAVLGEKATLRKDLENWRTRKFTPEELEGFDLVNILGKPCLVTIGESGPDGEKRKVTLVTNPPKGTVVPPQVNASVNFSLEPDEFNEDTYNGLSDWFKDTIAQSPEFQERTSGAREPMPPADYADVDFANDDLGNGGAF